MAVAEPPARFEQVRDKAAGLVDAPSRLQRLLGQASRKLATLSHGRFGELARQLSLALEMVRAHLAGEYTELSKPTLVSLIAALLYFVTGNLDNAIEYARRAKKSKLSRPGDP